MRNCFCEDCEHKDKEECIDSECDCCGEIQEYEHDMTYEEKEEE